MANLQRANLRHANLHEATLCGADLRHANLQGADLGCASLVGGLTFRLDAHRKAIMKTTPTNFRGADLRGADLSHAEVWSGPLSGVYLPPPVLTGAIYDAHTRWPPGFDPASYGALRVK
jgi:uncharacterized protein YjbI with pentapeptide repeats